MVVCDDLFSFVVICSGLSFSHTHPGSTLKQIATVAVGKLANQVMTLVCVSMRGALKPGQFWPPHFACHPVPFGTMVEWKRLNSRATSHLLIYSVVHYKLTVVFF